MALARPQVTKTQDEAETLNTAGVEATATAAVVEAEVVSEAVAEAVASSEPMTEQGVAATQAVAVAEPAEQKAVSVTEQRTNAMAQFSADQAAAGFEGLDLTGMSFDRIKMHEGKFLLGSEEAELGTEFDCVIHSTRRLYVVRQSTDQDAESYYSYDAAGATFTDGSCAADKRQDLAEEGYCA